MSRSTKFPDIRENRVIWPSSIMDHSDIIILPDVRLIIHVIYLFPLTKACGKLSFALSLSISKGIIF